MALPQTQVRPMRESEDEIVHAIYMLCHPTFPPRAWRWFEAHPTLVLLVDGAVVGYTSYSVVMDPNVCADGEVMIGYGIDIKPGHQGKGYGRLLCDERLALARAVGAKVFVGHADPGNLAMGLLFESDGFKPVQEVAGGYPDGTKMLLYMGPIR